MTGRSPQRYKEWFISPAEMGPIFTTIQSFIMPEWVVVVLCWVGNIRTSVTAILAVLFFVPPYHWLKPFAAMLEDPILRPTLMAIIVLSASLATYPLEDMWTTVGMYSAKRRRLMRLKSLKPREKKVLGAYLQNERTTQRWSPPVGTVDILAQDRILYRVASNLGPHVYAIDDDVWKHLNANPWLVQLDRYSLV